MNTQRDSNDPRMPFSPFEVDNRAAYLRRLGERAMQQRRRELERVANMGVREIIFCLAVYTLAIVAATLMFVY